MGVLAGTLTFFLRMKVIGWLNLCLLFGIVASWEYERQSGVQSFDSKSFEKALGKKNRLLYIEFYKSSEAQARTKKSKKLWSATAQALKGVATVAAVDCEAHSDICEKVSIEKYPSIHVRQGKGEFQKYEGKIDKKSVMADAKKRIPTKVKSFKKKKKLTKYLNKKKKYPKALVFVKNTGSLIIKSLAMQLKGRMVFAEVSKRERKLVKLYRIEKFPTLIVIAAAKSKKDKLSKLGKTFYSGRFTGASLQPWLNARALPGDSDDEIYELVEQLTDDSCMKFVCLNGGLCATFVISQDPTHPDKTILKEYLPLIKQLEDDQTDSLYHFGWIEGIGQMEFLKKAFGMEPRDYPQLVVFNAKRLVYTTFIGSFSYTGIQEFLKGVKAGKIRTQPMGVKKMPSIAGDTERCKDMKPPAPKYRSSQPRQQRPKRGYRGNRQPVDLTEEDWDELLVPSAANWMVLFYDREDPKILENWKQASLKMKGMVRFGVVDCTEVNEALAKAYDVDSFPTVKVFSAGAPKKMSQVDDYNGDFETENLVKKANELLDESDDVVLRLEQKHMKGFFQKKPRQPRLLLLTEKKNTPRLWKAVSLEFRHELIFSVSSDKQLATGVNAQQFPQVVILMGELGEMDKQGKADLRIRQSQVPRRRLHMRGLLAVCDDLAYQWKMVQEYQKMKEEGSSGSGHDEL